MIQISNQIGLGELILASITLIYVGLTYWLVRQNKEQMQTMLKQGKRERIIDLIQCIITPFIIQLETNEKLFKTRDYNWYYDPKTKEITLRMNVDYKEVKKLIIEDERDDIIFKDFLKKHNTIHYKVFFYNREISKFKEQLLNFIKIIMTSEFEDECNHIAQQAKITYVHISYSTANWIMDNLLMKKESFDIKYGPSFDKHIKNFYDDYGVYFLRKIKNNKKIIAKKNGIIDASKNLEDESKEFKMQLNRIREVYGEEYNIPKKDYNEKIDNFPLNRF